MKTGIKAALLLAFAGLVLAGNVSAQEVYTSSGKKPGAVRKQQKPKGFDPQRLVFGGGFNLGFGQLTNIGISPVVGYRFTDNFLAGIGVGYQYYSQKDFTFIYNSATGATESYPIRSSMLYPSVWARYVIYQNVFAHVEGEYDFQSLTYYAPDPATQFAAKYKEKYNSPALLVGAGLRQPVSDRSSFVVMALFDVIRDKYSPYRDPITLRIGFNAGF